MNKSNIQPLGDRILIKPVSEEKKENKAGIIIPETDQKEKPDHGEVIAVGEGRQGENGKIIPLKVKVGDMVIFSKYSPDEIEIEGEEYFIISESNILAVIK